jgi:dihydroorotase
MPNTIPVNDSRSVTEFIATQAAEQGTVAVYPIGCVTKGQMGEELAEMGDMIEAGARAFSDDGKPVLSSLIMRKALEYSQIFDLPIIDHCEDPVLVDGGVMNEGDVSTRLGLRGWPGVAEDVMVERDIMLADYTGGHVHIAHMSTGRSADLVREGKRRNVRVTCEVTPHHLVLTDEAVATYDTSAKMNPPLRDESDRTALIEALADGTVDAIATDHAPHHSDEKCVEFALAPFGIVGLETAISLCLGLVHEQAITLERMVELFTVGPARVLRLDKGTLAQGADADITVLDLDRELTLEAASFESKSANSPFLGWKVRGAPVMTLVGGRIVHDARAISPSR